MQLVKSDEDRDGDGRLLCYVDVAGTDAGLRLLRNGRAIAAYGSRDGYGFHWGRRLRHGVRPVPSRGGRTSTAPT